jgi:hypothetical protein
MTEWLYLNSDVPAADPEIQNGVSESYDEPGTRASYRGMRALSTMVSGAKRVLIRWIHSSPESESIFVTVNELLRYWLEQVLGFVKFLDYSCRGER